MLRNFIVIAVLTVSLSLVVTPLSKGYDFIGPIIDRTPLRGEQPAEEEKATETPATEKPVVEETPSVPKVKAATKKKKAVVPSTIKEEQKVVPEKESFYVELTYEDLQGDNPMDKLPVSKSGNYIVVYRSQTCPYCDKLLTELKDNTGDYVLVSVLCKGSVRDLFYSRWIYSWPSFIVIKDKRVTYYGYGYRTLGEFKRLL